MRAPFEPLMPSKWRYLGGNGRFAFLFGVAAILALAACQTNTVPVQNTPPPNQAGSPSAAPPPNTTGQAAPVQPTQPPPATLNVTQKISEPMEPDTGAVAVILPLSGPTQSLGAALLEAVELALFEIGDDSLELLVYDSQGTAGGAEDAARLAVADGAALIVGPLFAHSAIAVRPVADQAGISVLALSNNREAAGGSVFLMGHMPGQQIDRIVAYAVDQGLRRFGLFAPQNNYGNMISYHLGDAVARSGGTVSQAAYFDPGVGDLAPTVRAFSNYDQRKAALKAEIAKLETRTDQISRQTLKRLETMETYGDPDYDTLLLPAGGQTLRNLAPLLAFYDVDPKRIQLLGTSQWEDTGLGAEPALLGGWFAAPDPAARTGFNERFEAAYGHAAPRIATLAYDAMAIAAVLGRGADGPDYSLDRLLQPSGFAGTDGLFRLLPDGTNQRGLAVLEIERGSFKVLDPAPQSFNDLTN